MDFKLKKYFACDVLSPILILEDIYINKNHTLHDLLLEDLNSISKGDVLKYYHKHEEKINFLNHKVSDKMICSKIMLLSELLSDSIYEDRLKALLNNEPYNKKEFKDLCDDENLIHVDKTSKFHDSIVINDSIYGLCLPLNAFNSSYWISQELNNLNLDEVDLKIRVDPFLKNFSGLILKSTVFSAPLNWNEIRFLKNNLKGQFKDYRTDVVTEYLWNPRKHNEIVFTCEELPSEDEINLRGSRYFHAIFEKNSGKFIHADGSIKIYDKKSFKERCNYSIDNNEINDIGNEVKIFRVDGNIPKEKFSSLIMSYFYWNYDLRDYFHKNIIK